jgi:hypothetical protein
VLQEDLNIHMRFTCTTVFHPHQLLGKAYLHRLPGLLLSLVLLLLLLLPPLLLL